MERQPGAHRLPTEPCRASGRRRPGMRCRVHVLGRRPGERTPLRSPAGRQPDRVQPEPRRERRIGDHHRRVLLPQPAVEVPRAGRRLGLRPFRARPQDRAVDRRRPSRAAPTHRRFVPLRQRHRLRRQSDACPHLCACHRGHAGNPHRLLRGPAPRGARGRRSPERPGTAARPGRARLQASLLQGRHGLRPGRAGGRDGLPAGRPDRRRRAGHPGRRLRAVRPAQRRQPAAVHGPDPAGIERQPAVRYVRVRSWGWSPRRSRMPRT